MPPGSENRAVGPMQVMNRIEVEQGMPLTATTRLRPRHDLIRQAETGRQMEGLAVIFSGRGPAGPALSCGKANYRRKGCLAWRRIQVGWRWRRDAASYAVRYPMREKEKGGAYAVCVWYVGPCRRVVGQEWALGTG